MLLADGSVRSVLSRALTVGLASTSLALATTARAQGPNQVGSFDGP